MAGKNKGIELNEARLVGFTTKTKAEQDAGVKVVHRITVEVDDANLEAGALDQLAKLMAGSKSCKVLVGGTQLEL